MFIDSDYDEIGNEFNAVFYTEDDKCIEFIIILN